MHKRICAIFLMFAVIACPCSFAYANEPSEWARESALTAEQIGVGYPAGLKEYGGAATRAELAYTAVNLHKLLTGAEMSIDESDKLNITSTYRDIYTSGAFDEPEIALAIKYGLMFGTGDTLFSPYQLVTREQTAAVLYRIAEKSGVINISNKADISGFIDADQISQYAYESFQVMVGEGVLSGKSSDVLSPKGNCTYEELLAIAVRFWNLNGKANNADDLPYKSIYGQYDDVYGNEYSYENFGQFNEEAAPAFYSFEWEMDYNGNGRSDIPIKDYMSDAEAMLDMANVTVNVWNLAEDGTKTAAKRTFLVHKDVAEEVVGIFDEIFYGYEKFPIYAVIGYSFRGAGSKSSHNNGLAIDINPDENYFIDTEGGILAGKHWKPYEDPYSITPDGDVVRAFNNKGWYWGGIGWSTTGNDYMHFSYTGV